MRSLFEMWIVWCVRRSRPGGAGGLREWVRLAGTLETKSNEEDALKAIARERIQLLASPEVIDVQDFGAGYAAGVDRARHGSKPRRRALADIARRAAIPDVWGRFLFLLVRRLVPLRILELGTSLGISGAYLVAALRLNAEEGIAAEGKLVTLEGDPQLADRARGLLDRHGKGRARVVAGRFDETLDGVLATEGPFDLVFIDGHHEEDAARRYFQIIRPHVRSGGIVVFDDLEPWSSTVHRAWRSITKGTGPDFAVHLGKMGLLRVP